MHRDIITDETPISKNENKNLKIDKKSFSSITQKTLLTNTQKIFVIKENDKCSVCQNGSLKLRRNKKTKGSFFSCDKCFSTFSPNSKIPIRNKYKTEPITIEKNPNKKYAFSSGDICPTCKKQKLLFRKNKKTKKYFLCCSAYYCKGLQNVKIVNPPKEKLDNKENDSSTKKLTCSNCKSATLKVEHDHKNKNKFYYCYNCNSSSSPLEKESIQPSKKKDKQKERNKTTNIKSGDTCHFCNLGKLYANISKKTGESYFICSSCG